MVTIDKREPMVERQIEKNKKSHMPDNSLFYEKIVPILMLAMGIITAALILFAAGVLLGFVNF